MSYYQLINGACSAGICKTNSDISLLHFVFHALDRHSDLALDYWQVFPEARLRNLPGQKSPLTPVDIYIPSSKYADGSLA